MIYHVLNIIPGGWPWDFWTIKGVFHRSLVHLLGVVCFRCKLMGDFLRGGLNKNTLNTTYNMFLNDNYSYSANKRICTHIFSASFCQEKNNMWMWATQKKTLPGVSSFPPAALPLPPGSSGSSGSCCRSSADSPAQNSRNSQLQWTWWHERGEIKGAPFCWLGDLLGDGPIYIYKWLQIFNHYKDPVFKQPAAKVVSQHIELEHTQRSNLYLTGYNPETCR